MDFIDGEVGAEANHRDDEQHKHAERRRLGMAAKEVFRPSIEQCFLVHGLKPRKTISVLAIAAQNTLEVRMRATEEARSLSNSKKALL